MYEGMTKLGAERETIEVALGEATELDDDLLDGDANPKCRVKGRPDDVDSAATCSTAGVEVWAATVVDGVELVRGENRAGPGPKRRNDTVCMVDTVV